MIVNNKYSSYQTLIPEQFVGVGIRRTNSYSTKLLKEEMNDKRIEFWETRLESEAPYWHVIRQAVEEQDETQSLIILQQADLQLGNNSLQQIFNSQGYLFEVPVFLINEPEQYPTVKFCDTNIIQDFNEDEFEVIINLLQKGYSEILQIQSKDNVALLKYKVQEIAKVEKCRLFVSGRELQNHHQIGNYSISYGTIIQAFM